MSVAKEELKKYLGLIYGVASHDLSLDTSANRELIWAFAKKIVLADQQKLIDAAENDDEKLLILNLILLKLAQQPDFSLPPDLNELVAQYEKHQQELKKEPDAQRIVARIRHTIAPHSLLADEYLESIEEVLTSQISQHPDQTVDIVSRLIPPLAELNIPLQNLAAVLSPDLPPEAVPFLVSYKLIEPSATPAQITQFIDTVLLLKIEAQGYKKPESISPRLAQVIASFNLTPPAEEFVQQTLSSQAGLTPTQADIFTKTDLAPAIHYTLSFIPRDPNPKTDHQNRLAAFKSLHNIALEYLSLQQGGRQWVMQLMQSNINYESLYETSEHVYNQPDVQAYYLNKFSSQPHPFQQFIIGQGKSFLQDKATKAIVDKLASSLGTKVATTAAVEAGTAVAVGAEVAAGPPGWVLAAATVLATFGKDILSWAKRNFKKLAIAIGATIGLLIGGPVGAVLGAVGGFVLASPIVSLSATANSIATGITSASTALVGLVATEIAAPVIVIGLSIPVAIALILFIINTSALVVPPNPYGINNPNPIGTVNPFNPVVGTCPIESGFITCGSYGTSTTVCPDGHGGNNYWANKSKCDYSIPIGPSCINNQHSGQDGFPKSVCYNPSSTCSTYGYATDVSLNTLAGTPVYLPKFDGAGLDWKFQNEYTINGGSWGYGRVYGAQNGTNTYELYLGHMNKGQNTLGGKSGTLAGTLFCLTNITRCDGSHVHIELKINGIDQVPDSLCK